MTTWRDRAYCLDSNADFFPSTKYDEGKIHRRIPAVDLCLSCPVWLECLDDADDTGLRGRLSPLQRKKLLAHREATLGDFVVSVVPAIEEVAVNLPRMLAET